MQPDCRWSRRCSRDTTAEHAGFSHCSSSPPRTFSTTSDALVNVVAVTGCMSLQEGHCMSSSSADVRTLSQTHSAHTSLRHGVVTGRSTMLLQMAHWKSERFRLVEGGRKRERERGAVIFQVPGASRWMALAMPFLLLLPGLPRLTGSFIFLPPRCSAELMVQTSHPSPCADQRWTFRLLSAPLIFSSLFAVVCYSYGSRKGGELHSYHQRYLLQVTVEEWHCCCTCACIPYLAFARILDKSCAVPSHECHSSCFLNSVYHQEKNCSLNFESVTVFYYYSTIQQTSCGFCKMLYSVAVSG